MITFSLEYIHGIYFVLAFISFYCLGFPLEDKDELYSSTVARSNWIFFQVLDGVCLGKIERKLHLVLILRTFKIVRCWMNASFLNGHYLPGVWFLVLMLSLFFFWNIYNAVLRPCVSVLSMLRSLNGNSLCLLDLVFSDNFFTFLIFKCFWDNGVKSSKNISLHQLMVSI